MCMRGNRQRQGGAEAASLVVDKKPEGWMGGARGTLDFIQGYQKVYCSQIGIERMKNLFKNLCRNNYMSCKHFFTSLA